MFTISEHITLNTILIKCLVDATFLAVVTSVFQLVFAAATKTLVDVPFFLVWYELYNLAGLVVKSTEVFHLFYFYLIGFLSFTT